MDLAKEVTTGTSYEWVQGSWIGGACPEPPRPIDGHLPLHVAAYDYGIKRNILRMLVDRGCRVTVVPGTDAGRSAGIGAGRRFFPWSWRS